MPSNEIALKAHKTAEADANTKLIARKLLEMKRDGVPINVSSVAKATGLDRNTIRRRPDLHQEITTQTVEQAKRPKPTRANAREAASFKDMQARWHAAMSDVTRLREENQNLRSQLHQRISGIEPAQQSPLQEAKDEAARLSVDLVNLRKEYRDLEESYNDLNTTATEANSINRAYTRLYNALPVKTRDQYRLDHYQNR